MNQRHHDVRRIIVHSGHGEASIERVHVPAPDDGRAQLPTLLASEALVQHLMSNQVICASLDLDVRAAIALMTKHHIGCLPVVDHCGVAIGVVTKFDIFEQLDSPRRHVSDVMMPLTLSVPFTSTIARVATLMAVEDVHHILVRDEANHLAGVVSALDIVRWFVAGYFNPAEPQRGAMIDSIAARSSSTPTGFER